MELKTQIQQRFQTFSQGNSATEYPRLGYVSGKSSIFWALYTFLQSSQISPAEDQKYFDSSHRENLINIDMTEVMKTGNPYQTHLDRPPDQSKPPNWLPHIHSPKGVFTQNDAPCGMSGGNIRKP